MKTRDVLSELGFKENWDPRYAGLHPAYQYDFGNLELRCAGRLGSSPTGLSESLPTIR
jgi:hypothetical protein